MFRRLPHSGFRFFCFSTLALGLMLFDYHSTHLDVLRNYMSDAAAPMEYIVNWPIKTFDWMQSSFSTHHELTTENAQLRAELLLTNARLQTQLSLEKENAELKALLRSSSRVEGGIQEAQLLAVNLEPYIAEVILNKGKKDQVYEGQAVLDAHGVLGQVIKVGYLTSRVMLISDSRSAVPVEDDRTGYRSILIGKGLQRSLELINVPETTDIRPGDVLVTSGLGLRYPAGYPVGTVMSVNNTTGEHFLEIAVQPAAHLDSSRQVLLIWEKYDPAYLEAKKTLEEDSAPKMSQPSSEDPPE